MESKMSFIFVIIITLFTDVLSLYDKDSDVINLSPKNFDKRVFGRDEVWVVEFYAPWCGHCKAFKPEYDKLATALKGVVKVGAVNADDNKELSRRFNVVGYPTIKIFGEDKTKPSDYNGERSAKSLAMEALEEAKRKVMKNFESRKKSKPSSDVIELTDNNFDDNVLNSYDMWLVEFFAPWCGHCKKLAPEYAIAASKLKEKAKLGALDATVHTKQSAKYKLEGYPTILFFPPGKKIPNKYEVYDEGRSSEDIIEYMNKKILLYSPAPEVVHLNDYTVFEKACTNHPICIVGVLPHLLDCQSDCRQKYINVLKTVSVNFKDKDWGWVWCGAGEQKDLEENLGMGGFGYPALGVMNVNKIKHVVMKGSFSKESIVEFLRDISYGRSSGVLIQGTTLPNIASVSPWDGKDFELETEKTDEEPPLEDETKDEL